MWQGIAQVFGEAVNYFLADYLTIIVFFIDCFCGKAILGAVSFIGDNNDVAALRQAFISIAFGRLKLLNS